MGVELVYETHSISQDNERGIATGWLDGALSERGREAAKRLGTRRCNDGVAAVICSDLGRAVETAEIAFANTGIPVRQDRRLREINYGRLNGEPVARIDAERLARIHDPFPDGESYQQVVERTREFLLELAHDFDGKRVVVIGHSATRWALDHLINGRNLAEAIIAPFAWQEGWLYHLAGSLTPPTPRAREQILTVDDDASLWTVSTGEGPGLVLCHGGPGLHDYLAPVAAMLDDRFTVHRWDQRGAGRSAPGGPFTLERFIDDLDAIRAHFGYDRWIVGGHSWGAALALRYALANPERTSALIYISGTGLAWSRWKQAYHDEQERRLDPEQRARFKRLDGLRNPELSEPEEHEFHILNDLPNYADRSRSRALAEANVEQMLRYPINYEANQALGAAGDTLGENELGAQCARLNMPVLVLHGEGDPHPASATDSLVGALTDCERVIITEVGHMPWMENPRTTYEALRAFIDRLDGSPA